MKLWYEVLLIVCLTVNSGLLKTKRSLNFALISLSFHIFFSFRHFLSCFLFGRGFLLLWFWGVSHFKLLWILNHEWRQNGKVACLLLVLVAAAHVHLKHLTVVVEIERAWPL